MVRSIVVLATLSLAMTACFQPNVNQKINNTGGEAETETEGSPPSDGSGPGQRNVR